MQKTGPGNWKSESGSQELEPEDRGDARAKNPGTLMHSYRPDSPGSPGEALFKYIRSGPKAPGVLND